MVEFTTISLTVEGGIATLLLDRPSRRNAIDMTMRAELRVAIDRLRNDDDIKVCILAGTGGSFCAGGDITTMRDRKPGFEEARQRMRSTGEIVLALTTLEKPLIAVVDGPAFGAGFSLALAADFIVATPRASFCAVFGRVGLVPDLGAMQLLPRIVGLQRAKELVFSTRVVAAEEARALGIVWRIVPPEQLQDAARALAARFADASTDAIGMAKSIMNQAFHLDAHAMAELEAYAQTMARHSDYHQQAVERIRAKQPPRFDWKDD